MKKIYLLLFFIGSASALFSQTLFTYGNSSVDKEEFIRAYNKNKTPVTDKEKALRDYLDLFINFKLKVKAAREQRLDTLQQLQTDLQNFRIQVEETYMNNEKAVSNLVDEAFNRSQKDIHVIHFFGAIDDKMIAADTVKVYNAMKELEDRLNGTTNYEELVQEVSKKNGAALKQADIGFITVFTLPYEYENVIYGLKPGESGKSIRSKSGLHIFKVVEERKSAGKWKIAQILLAFPPGDKEQYMKGFQQKADSIYNALQHGADFTAMANQFSDDKLTYMAGGEMAEFGAGKFEPSFEKEVFKLSREGEIGKPFASAFGLHIIKVLKLTPTPVDKNDPTYMYNLKQKVLQDARIIGSKEKFVRDITALVGLKRNAAVKDAELFRYADSIPASQPELAPGKFPITDKVVLRFAKGNVKGAEWLLFVRDYKSNAELYKGETNAALLDKFIAYSTNEYYKKHLEEYNADFRNQMEEFKEGNVLFEIMERNVWGNASGDTMGLLKHYNENSAKYLWGPSAMVLIFNCNNKSTAAAAIAALKGGKNWKQVVIDGNNDVQADSGRYEISQLPLSAGTMITEGMITEPTINSPDGVTGFLRVLKLYEGNQHRTFSEARGLVINDYQNILEERWVQDLKKRYPIKINESVFQSLLK